MDFDFTAKQKMLRTMAREFLAAEFPKKLVRQLEDEKTPIHREVWQSMAKLGWMGLVIPKEYGGAGGNFLDLIVLLEETGRACLVAPYFSTAMSVLTILDGGSEEQKRALLPLVVKGEVILTTALNEPSGSYEADAIQTSAKIDKDTMLVNGTKLFVHDAEVADYFICATKTAASAPPEDGITVLIVDARSPGISVSPIPTIGEDRQNEVVFKDVIVPASRLMGGLNEGWPIVSRFLERAALGKCAEMIGGADWTLENCVEYAKVRKQYGRAIGSFQILQHYMAEMWMEVGHAKQLLYKAAWNIDRGLPATEAVAMAKARLSDSYRRWTAKGVQIHGGIGVTREFDMGLYYRRARQAAVLFGGPDFWREKVATSLGL